ncbi:pectin lyase F [Phytophthora cinnamomi]|uniref:pectin lyase F n=1 Tax=Phytophthora cinnamomi TaxID=4785 RepID=UPI0035594C96|nr:pectin lyase F [Phytophthora cinnamomi]
MLSIRAKLGFAAGTTGGGSATPDYPATIEELKHLLSDDQPRVIVLDKEFNFVGTEGTITETGCRPRAHTECLAKNNGFKGQDVILFPGDTTLTHTGGCDQQVKVQVTYDKATKDALFVSSNKTLRGIDQKGILRGKDLTISNSDFDGRTEFSTSCDGRHYWGFILDGTTTRVSFLNNYIHETSGRSPKIVGASSPNANVVAHIANNYWADNSGHSFEPGANAFVLAEGNYFDDTVEPVLADESKSSISTADDCRAALGRACSANVLEKCGAFDSVNGGRALDALKQYKAIAGYIPAKASQLAKSSTNFGVGDLGDSPIQGNVKQGNGSPSPKTTARKGGNKTKKKSGEDNSADAVQQENSAKNHS